MLSPKDLTVHDDAPADTCPQDHRSRIAAACKISVPEFGKCRASGVILHSYRHRDPLPQSFDQVHLSDTIHAASVVGISGLNIQKTGHAEGYSRYVALFGSGFLINTCDGFEEQIKIFCLRRDFSLSEKFSLGSHDRILGKCTAYVYYRIIHLATSLCPNCESNH